MTLTTSSTMLSRFGWKKSGSNPQKALLRLAARSRSARQWRRATGCSWDVRGHGRSAPNAAPCTIPHLAADLQTVLDAAGIDRAVILGHSAGGVVAMQFALDHPARTAGLVLVGTASECNQGAPVHQLPGGDRRGARHGPGAQAARRQRRAGAPVAHRSRDPGARRACHGQPERRAARRRASPRSAARRR